MMLNWRGEAPPALCLPCGLSRASEPRVCRCSPTLDIEEAVRAQGPGQPYQRQETRDVTPPRGPGVVDRRLAAD